MYGFPIYVLDVAVKVKHVFSLLQWIPAVEINVSKHPQKNPPSETSIVSDLKILCMLQTTPDSKHKLLRLQVLRMVNAVHKAV